jgi:hypothetical protein
MRFSALAAVIAATVLLGCGVTQVVQVSPTTYSVSSRRSVPEGSWDRAQQDAIAAGKEHCASQGKAFVMLNEQRSGVPGFSMQESKITFGCGENLASVVARCKADLQTPTLDAIRDKVELYRQTSDEPVPFAIATNDSFPTDGERQAIASWATLRDECIKRSSSAAEAAGLVQDPNFQRLRSIQRAAGARIGELIVSLYQQKLTYGDSRRRGMRLVKRLPRRSSGYGSRSRLQIKPNECRRSSSRNSNSRAISLPGPRTCKRWTLGSP